MKIVLLDEPRVYDGLQLSTGFVDTHAPGDGDAMVLFEGACDVPVEHLVDLEDAEARAFIYSPCMAHVVTEHRDIELAEGVLRQRLLVRLAAEWVSARSGRTLAVRGDDLFAGSGKLSVSVATRSPRGVLIHLGLNVDTDGAPVEAAGLRDLRLAPREFLKAVARAYTDELTSVAHAVNKVRPVP